MSQFVARFMMKDCWKQQFLFNKFFLNPLGTKNGCRSCDTVITFYNSLALPMDKLRQKTEPHVYIKSEKLWNLKHFLVAQVVAKFNIRSSYINVIWSILCVYK